MSATHKTLVGCLKVVFFGSEEPSTAVTPTPSRWLFCHPDLALGMSIFQTLFHYESKTNRVPAWRERAPWATIGSGANLENNQARKQLSTAHESVAMLSCFRSRIAQHCASCTLKSHTLPTASRPHYLALGSQ